MKYKTIMLDINGYSRLAEAKEALGKRMGITLSFNDMILELVSKNPDFLNIDDGMKDYISGFVDAMKGFDYVVGVLLFGSVAKESFGEHSDIDVLVLTKPGGKGHLAEIMDKASGNKEGGDKLMERGLPSLISPVILSVDDLKTFRPFYLDLADYGVVLYEKGHILSDFIYGIRRMRHKRESINNAEVLVWG